MGKYLILQLKARIFSVSQNEDGTLNLSETTDGSSVSNAGSIIGSLGGVDATLLRCYQSDENVEQINARILEAEKIRQQRLADNRDLIQNRGQKLYIGDAKFANVDERYFRYEQYSGWIEIKPEKYFITKEKHDLYYKKINDSYTTLVSSALNGVIPVTVDNLIIVMRYLNIQNFGTWELPKMSIGYAAHQYDCDGKIAITIKLDTPISNEDYFIENESMFAYGAPHGHLSKYHHLR